MSNSETKTTEVVNFVVQSRDDGETIQMNNVFVVDNIPATNPVVDVGKYPHFRNVSLSHDHGPVEILIGQDHADALLPLEVRKGKIGDPYAVRTKLGWSLNGPLSTAECINKKVVSNFICANDAKGDLERLWDIERDVAHCDKTGMSVEDKKVVMLWDQEIQTSENHYQIPIPFRDDVNLPNNVSLATSRLMSLGKSLVKRNLFERYDQEIMRLCDKHYAEKIPVYDVARSNVWYLPHQAVLSAKNPNKLRVVFDCSSKFQGVSLNDVCLQGPDLNRLLDVILRFRNHRYAICADIEAMYYQVRVPLVDRDYLRFLWYGQDGSMEHYRMLVHVFGGVWSGSAATYALRRTLCDFDASNIVKETVMNAFYVDDCLASVSSISDAQEVIHGVRSLLHQGGFNLTKFVINDESLMSEIPADARAIDVKELNSDSGNRSKVLGIKWDVKSDCLYFDLKLSESDQVTRRMMLSTVSSLFDPIGLVSPVLVQGKILFQDATRMQLGWDEPVPPDLARKWISWLRSLDELENIRVPRCVKPSGFDDGHLELHHFSDASASSYGCCSYLHCINKAGEIHTSLLCSKGRLAPIKTVSIPRLELQAAVLAARLDSVLRRELHLDLGESRFWVDSEVVLKYIYNVNQRFHVYVANRVSEIHRLTNPSQWFHVAGIENPADIISRGLTPTALVDSSWMEGPDFLKSYKSDWKNDSGPYVLDVDDPEVKSKSDTVPKVLSACSVKESPHPIDSLIGHFSSWSKLKRSMCWLLRFKDFLKKRDVVSGPLTVSELKDAEVAILKHVQLQSYASEVSCLNYGKPLSKSNALRNLMPFLDDCGLLRVGGRLKNAEVNFEKMHPIIVPHKSPIATLIVRDIHNIAHLGTEWVVSLLREKYWVTKSRYVVKNIRHGCLLCRKMYASPCVQRMADLPPERLMPKKPPFTYVGTDCFGPILVKQGRSQIKRYGCIFTCFTTRAVHIEVLASLDTDAMINALRRFISRRGCPMKIWSDNGTNYVGCRNELLHCLKQIDDPRMQDFCTKHQIEWIFNTPCAPHKGGVFERMIQTVKRVLYAMLGNSRLNDELLNTLLCEVESIVNGRPITKSSSDVCDPIALTPNHLLILRADAATIPGQFSVADIYRKRWRHVQHLVDVFWKRWQAEYLPQLYKASKWSDLYRNLSVNDLVLVVDESTPRGLWPMGIVTNVKLGEDGLVRTVTVRTKATQIVRPISKIVLLEGNL